MPDIFVIHEGLEIGPLPMAEARRMVANGALSRLDMAWAADEPDRVTLDVFLGMELPAPQIKPKGFLAGIPSWTYLVAAFVGFAMLCVIVSERGSPPARGYAAMAPLQTLSFGGLSLDAPVVFKKSPAKIPPLREDGRPAVVSMETYLGIGSNLVMIVIVVEFQPDTKPELAVAAKALLDNMAATQEARPTEYSARDTEVSGLPALRANAVFVRAGKEVNQTENCPVILTLIQSGSKMASIAIMQMKEDRETTERAQKILQSVAMTKSED